MPDNTPDILFLRCTKCHKAVPRNRVLPDKPLAQCPDCGCVFEPQELKRIEPPAKSRLRIRRSADSLEIVQNPLRTGLPLWTILSFVLFDLGVVVFYLYMQQLFPEENILELLRAEHDPDVAVGSRLLGALGVLHALLLPLPLWAFFDRRTIRLNRDTLKITGRWVFFSWKKTVSRLQTKKASFREWESVFYNLRISYGKSFLWIGCSSLEEVEMLRAEINYFLYTIEPSRQGSGGKAAFLGGAESFDPEIGLHCPDCGAKLTGTSLDLPDGTAHCPACRTDFPIDDAVAYRIDMIADRQPEHITVEQTDDRLTIRYAPMFSKAFLYGNLAMCYVCIFMFVGMLGGLLICIMRAEGAAQIIFFGIIGILCVVFSVYFYLMCMQDRNALFCNWMIQLDSDEVRLELCCKKRSKTGDFPQQNHRGVS